MGAFLTIFASGAAIWLNMPKNGVIFNTTDSKKNKVFSINISFCSLALFVLKRRP
jgi:hypothetical protein